VTVAAAVGWVLSLFLAFAIGVVVGHGPSRRR
jgi:hypothetical protein